MAYIYGRAAQSSTTRASAQRNDLLLRVALPLLFILILAGAGLSAFKQNQPWISALFAVFFVAAVLRFEELGLTASHYLAHSQTSVRARQVVAKALQQLPNEYHVFHDLNFNGDHLDHAVVGPNGFFTIIAGSHLGNVSASGESLRLNGWPFLLDLLSGSWNQTQKLTKHLGLHYSGGLHPCPVLCFSRASVGIAGPVRGAMVVEAGNLVPAIVVYEESLPPDKILLLVEKLSEMVETKGSQPLCSQNQSQPLIEPLHPAQPDLKRPDCTRCGHKPTPGEFELFPHECPKCGRLYSFAPDEPDAMPDGPTRKRIWKPSVPQLAVAALLVAGGAGYLTHSMGLLPAWRSQTASHEAVKSQTSSLAKADAPPATASDAQTDVNASEIAAAPSDTAMAQPDSDANATGHAIQQDMPVVPAMPQPVANANATAAEAPVPQVKDAAESPAALEAKPGTAALAATDDPGPEAAQKNATLPDAKAQGSTTKPADLFDRGKLVVTSTRPVTLWFKNQQTFKELGPYEVEGKKDILLPKGFYNVVYLENGRRKQTTISFLSDFGQLDF